MNKFYFFLTLILFFCGGFNLAAQTGCNTLNIVSTTSGSVCGNGSVRLEATTSGTGDDIFWYDAATGGNMIGTGPQIQTPVLSQTTSFWVSEILYGGGGGSTLSYCVPIYTGGCGWDQIVSFTLTDQTGVKVIEHLNSGCSTTATTSGYGDFTATPGLTGNLTPGTTYDFTIGHSFSNQFVKIWIDFDKNGSFEDSGELVFTSANGNYETNGSLIIPPGVTGGTTVMRVMDSFGVSPFDSCTPGSNYGETHDYKVNIISVVCESPRVQVTATVNNVADEEVITPLPYSQTANTGTYGNNYSGAPGGICGTNSSLDGNDVVYHFKPDMDQVVDIQLSGLTDQNASVFIYESCLDIGQVCLAGAENPGSTADFGITEFSVFDENDYYIVISSSGISQTIGYTLTISKSVLNCANYQTPPQGPTPQYFTFGDTLDDLSVIGGNITWYSDAAGTMVLTGNTQLVDNTTYYASQTFNGCESNLLPILVEEQTNCNNFLISSTTTGASFACFGRVMLDAVGSGTPGAQINWYDAPTGGNLVNIGPTYHTPFLTQTTSYWVSEVFAGTNLNVFPSGYCNPQYTNSNCVGIKDFILYNNFGDPILEHLNTGCSSSGYGNFINDPDLTASLIPTNTYDFTLEHLNVTSLAVEIFIDFNRNGSFSDPGERVFSNLSPTQNINKNPTVGSINIPQSALPGETLMRIHSKIGDLTPSVTGCEVAPYGETHDYKVTIASLNTFCESAKSQVTVTNINNGDIQVSSLPFIDKNNNTSNYGDPYTSLPGANCATDKNYLNGKDVIYKYTATNNDMVDIVLSDLTDFYAGLFVYDDCLDIQTGCLAGVVAGASDIDFGIYNFPVTAGEDYYIVVSSWLSSHVGYTLEILSFDCTTMPAPTGSTTQDFVLGEELKDLSVNTTISDASLVWYSDPSGAASFQIPENTPLTNGSTYYVRQILNNCDDGPLLAITVNQIMCSALDIMANDETISCKGSTILTAAGSGNGNNIYWYNAPTNGKLLKTGSKFTTPMLSQTTSYYASEVKLKGGGIKTGLGKFSPESIFTGSMTTKDHGLRFDVFRPMTLVQVQVYPNDIMGGIVDIELRNSAGNILETASVVIPTSPVGTNGSSPVTVPLNFFILPGTGYQLVKASNNAPKLVREFSQPNFPYPLGDAGEITSSVAYSNPETNSYYYFYNWTIVDEGQILCQSPLKEIKAIVDPMGEIELNHTDLNYVSTENTGNYGNNFSGPPGSNCGGANYLDGDDVLYHYTAHPSQDEILTIELTNISSPGTGVFIYDSCAEVGINCLAGKVSEAGSSSLIIEDFYVSAGEDIYIVVSSSLGSVSYDIEISNLKCNNIPSPTIANPTPEFIVGEVLTDLSIIGSPHKQMFNWYAELSDIPNNPISNPGQTPIVDGEDYYITQTVLNCESDALMIVPQEFDCTMMNIVSAPNEVLCAPGGEVSLTAQGSGNGNEIFWYLAPVGGNVVNVGSVYNTSVSQQKSFWVSECFVNRKFYSNQGKKLPASTMTSQLSGYGLQFNASQAFKLESVDIYPNDPAGGNISIELRNASGDPIQSATVNVPPGNVTVPVTIPLNFIIQTGSGYWLAMVDGPALVKDSYGNNFPYILGPSGAIGEITAGRTNILDVANGSLTTNEYYYFFNWTISQAEIRCESTREKVTVSINNQPTPVPTGDPLQEFCYGAILSDIVINGSDIQWFDQPVGGMPLPILTPLQDNKTYYASQTQLSCESKTRLAITIDLLPDAALPIGISNQLFFQGETLADLDVQGTNLKWYKDQYGTQPISNPENYVLQNQSTYYVSQQPSGFCESDLLAIKVHLQLSMNNPIFESLLYFPNPMQEELDISHGRPIKKVVLYDLNGKKIIEKKPGQNELKLETSGISQGVYLLEVNIEGKLGYFKLIKE